MLNQTLNLALRASPDEFSLCEVMICGTSLGNAVFDCKSFYLAFVLAE